jgi:hypothetical protein
MHHMVDSDCNGNEYQGGKGGQCVGLTTLPPSCADCIEILGASTYWSPKGLSRPVMGLIYLVLVPYDFGSAWEHKRSPLIDRYKFIIKTAENVMLMFCL